MMIRAVKRILPFLALSAALAASVHGQTGGIGILISSDAGPFQQAGEGCRACLEKNGMGPGIHIHSLQGETPEQLSGHLATADPRIIIAMGTRAARFARDNAAGRPVVFAMVLKPDEFKVANSTALILSVSPGAKLKYLHRLLPKANRIGVLYTAASAAEAGEVKAECDRMGFQLFQREVKGRSEFPEDLKDISWRIDCFLMVNDPEIFFPKSIEYLLSNSLQESFPVVGLSSLHTKAGALLSFDFDYVDLGRQTGELAVRILKGEGADKIKPAYPDKVNISINAAVAEQLGLSLPAEEVSKADKVFGR
jgi:putative tryptophan/tyrosine transport system substrate-binding protein